MLFDMSTIEAKAVLEALEGPSCTNRHVAAVYERLRQQIPIEQARAAKRRELAKRYGRTRHANHGHKP